MANDVSRLRANILALMVTRRCNMTCAHCSVESGPQIRIEPSFEELRDRVTSAAEAGVHLILFTGGEPMLREKEVIALIRHARRLGLNSSMVTNGFWASSAAQALRRVRRLRRAGLVSMTISPDRYHAPFQAIDYSLHIARAARAERLTLNVNLTRAADDADLDGAVSAFHGDPDVKDHVRVRFFDVQPVGRARAFQALRAENEGSCAGCRLPSVADDGRVTACNGPSYFEREGSPLVLGSLRERPLADLLATHATDPILDTIRAFGAGRLRDELLQIPGFEAFPLRPSYRGMCELCIHLTSQPQVVAALRERLGAGKIAAELHAKKTLMEALQQEGPRHYVVLNSIERARVFWQVMHHRRWSDDSDRILGRADLDWKSAVEYLESCGLARPLVPRLDDRELTRWAPRFFAERLQRRAMSDTLRDFVVREILDHLNAALREIGAEGVLLKSAATIARATDGGLVRGGGDVDVWVRPTHAERLRERLIARGFQGRLNDPRTAAHHLAPLMFRSVPIEIHSRLMPAFWRLPEADMIERRTPLEGYSHLSSLDVEGTLLHAVVHCASHLFSHGLKTAWDVSQCAKLAEFDWDRLARWVEASAAPRAFWTLVNAFDRALGLELPRAFLARSPRDLKQARLEAIARRRAFSAAESAEELNPFSKNAVFLFLCDSTSARARLLLSLISSEASAARKTNWAYLSQQSSQPLGSRLRSQFRDAWRQWRDYRSVITSSRFRETTDRLSSGA